MLVKFDAIGGQNECKCLVRSNANRWSTRCNYTQGKDVILKSENPKYPARYVMEGDELVIWGVVKYSVRDHDKT